MRVYTREPAQFQKGQRPAGQQHLTRPFQEGESFLETGARLRAVAWQSSQMSGRTTAERHDRRPRFRIPARFHSATQVPLPCLPIRVHELVLGYSA